MASRESPQFAQLLREALHGRVGRRDLLLRAAALGLSLPAINTLLAACGGGTAAPEGTGTPAAASATSAAASSAASGEPVRGGKVTMAIYADVFSFDPPVPTDNPSIWTMVNIYDQLVRVGKDGMSVEAALAESWENTPDYKTWTFKLRDAKFQDGSPVTAEDVVYSLEHVRTSPTWGFIFAAFESVTAKDDKTVVIQFNKPWAPGLADLSLYGASIIPKRVVESKGDEFFNQPFGSGPFYVAEWAKGDHITLRRNQYYWGKDQPYLDEVEFVVIVDDNTRVLKLQAGELDIIADVPYNQIDTLKRTEGLMVQTDPIARVDYIALNHTKAPFDDVNLRKALNYAVDKEKIIKTVLFGNAEAANSLLPQMLYWNKDGKPYPYDVQKAKEFIAKSKVPNGFETELLIDAGNSVLQQFAVMVQNNLNDIGVKVNVKQLEGATLYTDYFQKYQYEMLAQYHSTDIIDPDEITNYALNPEGGNGAIWTGYKNQKTVELTAAAATELDPKKREDMYHQIQQMSLDDAQVLFLYFPHSRTGLRDWVHGFKVLLTSNYRMWEVWTTRKA